MSLDFPLSVRSRNLCFFSVPEGGKGLCFCCVFGPRSREGNSRLQSTRVNCSSFYGRETYENIGPATVTMVSGARVSGAIVSSAVGDEFIVEPPEPDTSMDEGRREDFCLA